MAALLGICPCSGIHLLSYLLFLLAPAPVERQYPGPGRRSRYAGKRSSAPRLRHLVRSIHRTSVDRTGVRGASNEMKKLLLLMGMGLLLYIGISILASYSDPQRAYRARVAATHRSIIAITNSLCVYRDSTGDFPTDEQGLDVLTNLTPSLILHDAWGSPLCYKRNTAFPDVLSVGADQQAETADDIR
jgi:hypothetical protein